ncbi:hypothetical protein GQ600_26950 [Phytophthora cactorum]|nr:hypothetical protein GQ600_26950 [Phytophthora cactorum]
MRVGALHTSECFEDSTEVCAQGTSRSQDGGVNDVGANRRRQSMLRLSSEEENTKLREAVTRHLQQAKSLQRAIKRKLKEDMMSSSLDFIKRNRLNARGIAPPLDNKELLAGIDSVYQGVDAFFEDTECTRCHVQDGENNTAISRVSKGVFVEFLDSYALPFDVRQTTKAIWTPEEDRSATITFTFCSFTAGNNTQMRSMAFAFSMEGVDFRVVMRAVTRKYIENGRTVFIKRTLIQPIYGEMSISLIETSRQVLKRGDLSAVGPTTVMQTHREATIHGDLTVLDPTKYPSVDIGVKNWESSISRYTTEGAIWTATDKSEDAANFTADNNTRMRSICCTYLLGGFDFCIVMRDVFLKYVEQDVFIRRTPIEPIRGLASVTFIETNRLVIQRGNCQVLGQLQ